MVYDIVLKNGKEIKGYAKNVDNVVEMMFKHDVFIIQEKNHPDKVTYILPKEVSHFRFPDNVDRVVKPVI